MQEHVSASPDQVVASHRLRTCAVLAAALAGPPVFTLVGQRPCVAAASLPYQIALQALYCGLAVFVLWAVVGLEQRSLITVGLRRPTWPVLGWAALLFLLMNVALPLLNGSVLSRFDPAPVHAGVEALARFPLWYRFIVGATGGAVEEILYRGYAVERLEELSGRTWVAAAVSCAAFAAAHIPGWGIGFAVAADLPFAVLMTLFYVWKRNLIANVLVHSSVLILAMFNVGA